MNDETMFEDQGPLCCSTCSNLVDRYTLDKFDNCQKCADKYDEEETDLRYVYGIDNAE